MSLYRLSKKSLYSISACILIIVACFLAILFFSSHVDVRQDKFDSKPLEDYLGLSDVKNGFSFLKHPQIEIQPIVLLDGTLWEWTGVKANLFLIQAGKVRHSCNVFIRTSSGRLDHSLFRYSIKIDLAICIVKSKDLKLSFLTCSQAPSATGVGTIAMPNWQPFVMRHYERSISWWKNEIVYVEGKDEPIVYSGMSLDAFLKENEGDYLVVTVSLE